MKKSITCLSVIFGFLLSFAIQAQNIKMPETGFSTDLLSVLNSGNDSEFSPEVNAKVQSENKSFVNDVVGIMGSSDDDETKKMKINNRKKERDGVLNSAFGNDDALKSYKKKIDKQIKPFKRKYKMAKWIL